MAGGYKSKRMPVYKDITREQWNWIRAFELEFGFEVMYLDDFEHKEMTWQEFVSKNAKWIEDNMCERVQRLIASSKVEYLYA